MLAPPPPPRQPPPLPSPPAGIAAPAPAPAASRPAKVALLAPLSGANAELGRAILDAAQLALFEVPGERLILVPRDTAGTADDRGTSGQTAHPRCSSQHHCIFDRDRTCGRQHFLDGISAATGGRPRGRLCP